MMLQPVTVAGHVHDLAVMDESVEDCRSDGSIAKEFSPLVKAFVGRNDDGRSLRHGRDKTKEQVRLVRRERHKPDLVNDDERGIAHVFHGNLPGHQ